MPVTVHYSLKAIREKEGRAGLLVRPVKDKLIFLMLFNKKNPKPPNTTKKPNTQTNNKTMLQHILL